MSDKEFYPKYFSNPLKLTNKKRTNSISKENKRSKETSKKVDSGQKHMKSVQNHVSLGNSILKQQ